MKPQVNRFLPALILTLVVMTACNNGEDQKKETAATADSAMKTGITKSDFGTVDGKPVSLFTLVNAKGDEVKITNYGGIVTSWISPDKSGKKSSIVLGFDSLSEYLHGSPY